MVLGAAITSGQQPGLSPTDTAIKFYSELRQKRYVEGFRHSVYRAAVEGLAPADLKDLEPDFAATFSVIPNKIEPQGEQIRGDTALVKLKFEGDDALKEVMLIREGSEWLVGDKDALAAVRGEGRAFFFNARMLVNEAEAYEMLQLIVGAETIYAHKFEGRCASLEELIKLGGVPKDIETQGGYRFALTLGQDNKSFFATATPTVYKRTGRLSFYADMNGIRGQDLKGKLASVTSPVYVPK
jgi:hypothetical protein